MLSQNGKMFLLYKFAYANSKLNVKIKEKHWK